LLSDASCVPGDIRYPNDLGILNEARVGSEEIIDTLYEAVRENVKKKPKTYRKLARKDYLKVAKKRKPRTKQRKKVIKKQLQYLKRNLDHIERLIQAGASLERLRPAQYKMLLVITEVYRQQQVMYQKERILILLSLRINFCNCGSQNLAFILNFSMNYMGHPYLTVFTSCSLF